MLISVSATLHLLFPAVLRLAPESGDTILILPLLCLSAELFLLEIAT